MQALVKTCLFLTLLSFTGMADATEHTVVFEEDNALWSYTGYWRNSTQGHHGSGSAYAVGLASSTSSDGFGGQAGSGNAYLDLSDFEEFEAQIKLCFILHGNSYRSAETQLTVHKASENTPFVFSQRGTNNSRDCFNIGSQSGITGLSLSNSTPDGKWVSLDYVSLSYTEVVTLPNDSNELNLKSVYELSDIIPNKPMGINLVRTALIDEASMGITFSNRPNDRVDFAEVIIPIDDLDNNGIPELFVNIDTYVTNEVRANAMILFPDENGNILKHQIVDARMTRNTSWYHTYSFSYGRPAGDFDGNGIKDVALSPSFGDQNRVNVLFFDRSDATSEALYTIKGDIEFSNNRGQVPFQINRNSGFGSWFSLIGDADDNGVIDFWTILANRNGEVAPDIDSSLLALNVGVATNGNVHDIEYLPLPINVSNPRLLGDINNDGRFDLVTPHRLGSNDYYLRTLVSNGSSGYTDQLAKITKEGFENHMAINYATPVGDVNGDGNPDVIASTRPNWSNYRLLTMELILLDENQQQLGQPVTLFTDDDYDRVNFTGGAAVPVLLDLDNDGDLDMAVPARNSGKGAGLYFMYFE